MDRPLHCHTVPCCTILYPRNRCRQNVPNCTQRHQHSTILYQTSTKKVYQSGPYYLNTTHVYTHVPCLVHTSVPRFYTISTQTLPTKVYHIFTQPVPTIFARVPGLCYLLRYLCTKLHLLQEAFVKVHHIPGYSSAMAQLQV